MSPSASVEASAATGAGSSCPTQEPTPPPAGPSPAPSPAFSAPNLVQNPGAEADTGAPDNTTIVPPTGWRTTGGEPTAVQYGAGGGFPTPSDPGPDNRGANFFGGGNAPCSELTQEIDFSARATDIDAGKVTFYLAAWLGGWESQPDFATLTLTFLPSGPTYTVGPVTHSDRQDATGLALRATTGAVPAGARTAMLVLDLTRFAGEYDDGYADNVTLELSPTS